MIEIPLLVFDDWNFGLTPVLFIVSTLYLSRCYEPSELSSQWSLFFFLLLSLNSIVEILNSFFCSGNNNIGRNIFSKSLMMSCFSQENYVITSPFHISICSLHCLLHTGTTGEWQRAFLGPTAGILIEFCSCCSACIYSLLECWSQEKSMSVNFSSIDLFICTFQNFSLKIPE